MTMVLVLDLVAALTILVSYSCTTAKQTGMDIDMMHATHLVMANNLELRYIVDMHAHDNIIAVNSYQPLYASNCLH